MRQHRLGRSGLMVSELCLGCMSFGAPERGGHPWTLPHDASTPILRQAYEAGITFMDTANVYSDGASEEILGHELWKMARRDEIVLATKVFGVMESEPHMGGLSRRAILHNIEGSLRRLRTDHVDLYQIHRYDPNVPPEEVMGTLHSLVTSGKVRYLGASSMRAWQLAKLQDCARANGWTPFISMQNQINLIQREEEREMVPLCRDQGIGLIPWSPIARGRLARPWGQATNRAGKDAFMRLMYDRSEEADAAVVAEVEALARELGRTMAQVALAWVRQKEGVTAPIIGVTRPEQLADTLAGLDLILTPEQIARLEAPYVPHEVVGMT